MKILRQKFFNEENNLSKAGKATALLGGGGLAASTVTGAVLAIARSKNLAKYKEALDDEHMKNEKAYDEISAKNREAQSILAEKAKEKKAKGMWNTHEWYSQETDKVRDSYQKAYDKIVRDNHARVKEAEAKVKKNEKALLKALGGAGISAAVAAAGTGMYLIGRKKNKEDEK